MSKLLETFEVCEAVLADRHYRGRDEEEEYVTLISDRSMKTLTYP